MPLMSDLDRLAEMVEKAYRERGPLLPHSPAQTATVNALVAAAPQLIAVAQAARDRSACRRVLRGASEMCSVEVCEACWLARTLLALDAKLAGVMN